VYLRDDDKKDSFSNLSNMNEVLFNKIQHLKEILSNQSSVIIAYLFGSRVKGYANEKSDWDIAVYFSEPIKTKT